jgi:hypothetical protein
VLRRQVGSAGTEGGLPQEGGRLEDLTQELLGSDRREALAPASQKRPGRSPSFTPAGHVLAATEKAKEELSEKLLRETPR